MGNLLSAHSISKSYSSRFLFSDVSLHIHDQEKLGIIGPNGSGKSTLLKILSSLERPDDGEVTLRKGKRIHYVPQQDDFKSEETPLDILLQADSDFEESDMSNHLDENINNIKNQLIQTNILPVIFFVNVLVLDTDTLFIKDLSTFRILLSINSCVCNSI